MAAAPGVPPAFLGNLPNFNGPNDTLWNREGKVNGVWNTLLTYSFSMTLAVNGFLVCGEAPPAGQRLRPDLTVFEITNTTNAGDMQERVVYEGKSSISADGFDAIEQQLYNYFNGRGPLSWRSWAIGAKGSRFKVWIWNGAAFTSVSLTVVGLPTLRPLLSPTYDLTVLPAASILAFVNYLAAFPTPPL